MKMLESSIFLETFDGVFEWVDCLMTIRATGLRPLALLGKFFPCSDLFFKFIFGIEYESRTKTPGTLNS